MQQPFDSPFATQQKHPLSTPNKVETVSDTITSAPQEDSIQLQPSTNQISSHQGKISERSLVQIISPVTTPSSPTSYCHREMWPEFQPILNKIRMMEISLSQEHQRNDQLTHEIESLKSQRESCKEQIEKLQNFLGAQLEINEENSRKLQQLLENLQKKETQLGQKNELFSQLQMSQLKKAAQFEDKCKKMAIEQKDINERLRKTNIELQNERKINENLRNQMNTKIQQLQSDKQVYLVSEVEKLKQIIQSSPEQREIKLTEEITHLKRKVYYLSEELKRKCIEISLMERKKQQAINDAVEKKDHEVKVQKTLFKSLQEKLARLQEDNKSLKKNGLPVRYNKIMPQKRSTSEDDFILELSP